MTRRLAFILALALTALHAALGGAGSAAPLCLGHPGHDAGDTPGRAVEACTHHVAPSGPEPEHRGCCCTDVRLASFECAPDRPGLRPAPQGAQASAPLACEEHAPLRGRSSAADRGVDPGGGRLLALRTTRLII